MQYLVRLVCPAGGTVLDPFAGSGTTLLAARSLGMRAIGIEREESYCRIAVQRLAQQTIFQ
jgi:site-specific DNA-methyltransferase (adenine-specific)